MQEKFDTDLGLSWDEETNHSKTKVRVKGMRAIDADFSGATVQANNEIKYLDFKGREGNIFWYQENDGSAGLFTLKISYACKDTNSMRPMDLIINNKKVATLNFKPTDSWNYDWEQVITKQHLEAGANYIELRSTGQSAPDIRMLQVD
jgi:beta-galactosidase